MVSKTRAVHLSGRRRWRIWYHYAVLLWANQL